MNRRDFYFKQKVTEGELDDAFAQAELAITNLATDMGLAGIVSGAVPTQHAPVANLTIDLTGPGLGYDLTGRRIYVGTGQVVNCAVDENGVSTVVPGAGQERWLGVFLAFDRNLADERIDGNSQAVFFVRDEAYQIVVRQGAAAGAGLAVRVPLDEDMLLICDVKRTNWQAQIVNANIDQTRRQNWVFTDTEHIGVGENVWTRLGGDSIHAVFDSIEAWMSGHQNGTADRHPASAIDYQGQGFVNNATLEVALDQLISYLQTQGNATRGTALIGSDEVAGAPNALVAGTLLAQITALLGAINAHINDATAAHQPTAINGLDITTGTLNLLGATLAAYLQQFQLWAYNTLPRQLVAVTVVLAAGASQTAINNLTQEPNVVFIRCRETALDMWIHNGQDPAGGGLDKGLIDVVVQEDGANWDVVVRNNSVFNVTVYVQAMRVG